MNLYGLEFEIPEQVYSPAEDTDMCIEWLKEWAIQAPPNPFIIEIGCGPGTCSLFLQHSLHQLGKTGRIIAIDLNPFATHTTKNNSIINKLNSDLQIIQGDLANPLSIHQSKFPKFDLVVFNPPYLPAEEDIIDNSNHQPIDAAWEGGNIGDEITLEFLTQISPLLRIGGDVLFITSSFVDQSRIQQKMAENHIIVEEIRKLHVFFEDIILIHGKIKNQ